MKQTLCRAQSYTKGV